MHPAVQAHLQSLVQFDHIGCRKISTGAPGSEETTVYWLKNGIYKLIETDQILYSAILVPCSTSTSKVCYEYSCLNTKGILLLYIHQCILLTVYTAYSSSAVL